MFTATREQRAKNVAVMNDELLVTAYGVLFNILATNENLSEEDRAEYLFNKELVMDEILKRMGKG